MAYSKRNIYPSVSTAFFYFDKTSRRASKTTSREILAYCINFPLYWRQMKNTLEIILQSQDISFICFTSNQSSWHQISRRTIKCRHGKKTLSPILIVFLCWRFLSNSLSRAYERMNYPKHTTGEDIKRMHTMWNFFLAANWDSPKSSVKLLGHE